LKGNWKDTKIEVTEYNNKEKVTGKFIGELSGNEIKGKWQNADGSKSFDFVIVEENIESFSSTEYYIKKTKNITEDCFTEIELGLEYPINSSYSDGINKIKETLLKELLSEKYAQQNPQNAIQTFANSFIEGDATVTDSLTTEEGTDCYTITESRSITAIYNHFGTACFDYSTYEYAGGAHGVGNSSYLIYDIKTGNEITFKDIFNTDKEKELLAMLTLKIRGEDNISDEVTHTENIYITSAGIGFYYNVYEIGSYAEGPTDIILTYNELKPFLKPNNPISHLYK